MTVSLTSGGTEQQIEHLVKHGCLSALSAILDRQDGRVLQVALEGIR